jgi:hypothetical protein
MAEWVKKRHKALENRINYRNGRKARESDRKPYRKLQITTETTEKRVRKRQEALENYSINYRNDRKAIKSDRKS